MNDELYKEYLDEAAEARMDFPRWLDWLLLRNDPDAYAQQLRERDEDRYMARKQSAESFGHPDDY